MFTNQEVLRLREFTDWLHDEFLRAMSEATEAERIDRENDYSEFEETIARLETRGAKDAIVRVWNEWQKLRGEVDNV